MENSMMRFSMGMCSLRSNTMGDDLVIRGMEYVAYCTLTVMGVLMTLAMIRLKSAYSRGGGSLTRKSRK
jgi:hypothetical protein